MGRIGWLTVGTAGTWHPKPVVIPSPMAEDLWQLGQIDIFLPDTLADTLAFSPTGTETLAPGAITDSVTATT